VTDVKRDAARWWVTLQLEWPLRPGRSHPRALAPRLKEAEPKTLLNDAGDNLDPDRIWATLMKNEKPGGHGERSVAVGTIDMACGTPSPRSPASAVSPARRTAQARSKAARIRLRGRLLLSRKASSSARRDAQLSDRGTRS